MFESILNHLFRLPLKLIIFSILLPLFLFILQQEFTNFLNQEQERLEYSKKLIDLTERRAYLAENFYLNSKLEPDFAVRKEELWKNYGETLSEYNYNLVPSLIIVKKNYGLEAQEFYHNEVFMRLRAINIELAKIRTSEPYNETLLSENIETLRNRKYRFAETLLNCETRNLIDTAIFLINKYTGSFYCKVF